MEVEQTISDKVQRYGADLDALALVALQTDAAIRVAQAEKQKRYNKNRNAQKDGESYTAWQTRLAEDKARLARAKREQRAKQRTAIIDTATDAVSASYLDRCNALSYGVTLGRIEYGAVASPDSMEGLKRIAVLNAVQTHTPADAVERTREVWSNKAQAVMEESIAPRAVTKSQAHIVESLTTRFRGFSARLGKVKLPAWGMSDHALANTLRDMQAYYSTPAQERSKAWSIKWDGGPSDCRNVRGMIGGTLTTAVQTVETPIGPRKSYRYRVFGNGEYGYRAVPTDGNSLLQGGGLSNGMAVAGTQGERLQSVEQRATRAERHVAASVSDIHAWNNTGYRTAQFIAAERRDKAAQANDARPYVMPRRDWKERAEHDAAVMAGR